MKKHMLFLSVILFVAMHNANAAGSSSRPNRVLERLWYRGRTPGPSPKPSQTDEFFTVRVSPASKDRNFVPLGSRRLSPPVSPPLPTQKDRLRELHWETPEEIEEYFRKKDEEDADLYIARKNSQNVQNRDHVYEYNYDIVEMLRQISLRRLEEESTG